MKLKRSLKNKLKKILFVLPIFIVLFSLFSFPVSALSVNNYGFTISNQRLGASQSITPNFEYYINDVTTNQYGDNQIEFKFAQGNGSGTSAYRPMSFDLRAGNSNPQYSVNIQFVSYYADSSNNVFNFDGPAWAYINNARVTALQPYSKTPSSNSSLFYSGGSFAFNMNANQTLKITLSSGYNESYLQTVGYGVWITISPVDQSGAIIDNQDKNASEIIQNQNENTDEILNGWDTDVSPDDDTSTEYSDLEGALIDDTQDNADNANGEVNDNFVGSLQRYFSGFGAVSQMFSDLLLVQVPDVNGIVWFSLALGVVPLIVGSSIVGLRASNRASARQRSGFTRGKGG